MAVGGIATLLHDAILTPTDVLKQRMQLRKQSSLKIAREIVNKEGITSLYRSLPITMVRLVLLKFMNVPFSGTLVTVNENLKTKLKPQNTEHPIAWYFLIAGLAGIFLIIQGGFAAFLTTPLDVVKTKLQT
jgi:solute carrier family 25 iron transporter 28/37